MKTTLWIIGFIVFFCFTAGVKMSWKPFHFQLEYPWKAIGWVLIMAGLVCLEFSSYKKGVKEATDIIFEEIKKIQYEKKS